MESGILPKFKRVTMAARPKIEAYTKDFPKYCDFNFSNIYSWSDPRNPTQYLILNGNLVIKMADFTEDKEIVSFIGKNRVNDTVGVLLSKYPVLSMIPEECINTDLKDYEVTEDDNNHDYVLDLTEIAELKGNKYKNKRRHVNKFLTLYTEHTVKLLTLRNKEDRKDMISLISNWGKLKKERTERELLTVKRLMRVAHLYDLLVVGVYIRKTLVGFTINDMVKGEMALGGFGKADFRYKGIYQYLEQLTARELLKRGHKFINIEQDLGITGLRESKSSWHPYKILKKYIIKRK